MKFPTSRRIALYGLLICLSLIFSYVESFLILPVPVPGIKLGLANIVTLLALFTLPLGGALTISLLRVLLAALLFGRTGSLIFSLSGCLLSFAGMALARRSQLFSLLGVSILGGLLHNVGQLCAAAWVIHNAALLYYLPVLLAAGGLCGLLTGKVAHLVLGHLQKTGFGDFLR
ncbi:MAG: Gx transporter family protein [Eubacteriales bacterium]